MQGLQGRLAAFRQWPCSTRQCTATVSSRPFRAVSPTPLHSAWKPASNSTLAASASFPGRLQPRGSSLRSLPKALAAQTAIQVVKAAPGLAKVAAASNTASSEAYTTVAEAIKQRDQLAAVLKQYDYSYHTLAEPEIEDAAYDALKRRLGEVEAFIQQASGATAQPAATTVGAPVHERPKCQHPVPMLSLAAVNSPEDLTKWHDRLLQRLKSPDVALRATLPLAHIRMPWDPQGEPASASKASTSKGKQRQPQKAKKKLDTAPTSQSWTVEPKIDGLAVRLTYRGGQLIEAATRGDGKEGEDVTANAAMVANIPQLVCPPTSTTTTASKTGSNGSNLPAEFEVRGEVFISHADLAKLNEEQAVAGLPAYSNARNLAAGSLRLLDPAVTAKRRLSCIAYQLVLPPNCSAPLASQWEALQWLQDHGFSTNADNHRCANFEGAKLVAGRWMFGRDKLGYDADGVVLKLDDLGLQRALGDIGGDPRWAIAWKFPANEAITRLLGITLTLGRMGQVTPVAILEPVVISNIRIMRATLHSIGDVLAKGFCVGDQVVIRRSNDVIPQVMRPILELRDGSQTAWEAPTHCPACKGTLTWRQDNKRVLMCGNAACSALAGKQVEHWAACCVPGLGKATVQQLVEDGLVKTVPDLYKLTEGQLMTLQGFAAKKAANLLAAIEASKSQPLPKLIHGLGIPSIGMTLAERIVQIITTLPELTTGRLMEDPSWAAVPAGARATLDSWSGEPTNAELVQALYDLGVGPRTASTSGGAPQGNNAAIMGSKSSSSSAGLPDVKGTPLLGKSVVITGSFQYVDRDLARTTVQEIARKAGASVANGVSGRTDLLLTGNRPAEAKVAKAQKLGIEVVDKAAFWQIITGETPA